MKNLEKLTNIIESILYVSGTQVAIADIVVLSKYVISSKLYPLENATAVENADVTHDSEVTSADTQKLIEYIVNAISTLDV